MSRIVSLAIAALLLAVCGPAALAQRTGQRVLVTGTVVDSVSGDPLYGVAVATTTTHDHTASDSAGAFTLSISAGTPVMLTFTGGGWETVGQVVAATADVDLGRVALLPRAVALAPITATVSQLDQRVRQFHGSTFVYDSKVLEHSGERDLLEFVMRQGGLHPVACSFVDGGPMVDCVRVRGFQTRPQIWVNETRVGDLRTLRAFRPDDVARMEVYSGGMMIRIYTRGYLEEMARTNATPAPLPPF